MTGKNLDEIYNFVSGAEWMITAMTRMDITSLVDIKKRADEILLLRPIDKSDKDE